MFLKQRAITTSNSASTCLDKLYIRKNYSRTDKSGNFNSLWHKKTCSCWTQQEKPNDEFIRTDNGGDGNDHNLSESEELYDRLSTVNHRMVNVYEEIPGDSFSSPQPSSSSNSQQQHQEQQQQQEQSQPSINVASNPSALIPVRTQPCESCRNSCLIEFGIPSGRELICLVQSLDVEL
ncbi:unnamed protein product [Allacma fusca]|uniref:Uncharacterized protein n=1 Tax=Allacma fusca TaxID=39272 RepID=A0A8J2PA29_9HEXA|nr:unnamed protein product [Allacma fusca]